MQRGTPTPTPVPIVVLCPVGDDVTGVCVVCGDSFAKVFDRDREEWMYRDAVRVQGRLFHPACHTDTMAAVRPDSSTHTHIHHTHAEKTRWGTGTAGAHTHASAGAEWQAAAGRGGTRC
jgi:hypothetical protein